MDLGDIEIITPDDSLCERIAAFRNKIALTTTFLGSSDKETETNLRRYCLSNKGFYLVVMSGTKIIGYAAGYEGGDSARNKEQCLYIAKFGVDASVRGKGVSDKLMQVIFAKAKEHSFKYVELLVDTANSKAVSFYQRSGFVNHGSTYQEMRVGLESISNELSMRALVPAMEGSGFFLLPEVKNPQDLMKWMDKNLEYKGSNKGYLLSPEALIKEKVGHCWETTELTRHILKQLGYKTDVYYLETANCKTTHTTLIYFDTIRNTYNWFEWAWYKNAGIHTFKTSEETVDAIEKAFRTQYNSLTVFTHSKQNRIFTEADDENSCIQKMRAWEDVRKPTPLFGYMRVSSTEENVTKYKKMYGNLCHVKTGLGFKGDILLDGNKVVGFLQCEIDKNFIVALEINPEYRGLGIAKRLLTRAINFYGANLLSVRKTNTPAIELYKSTGWVECKRDGIVIYMKHKG